jgi:hypothetical protein
VTAHYSKANEEMGSAAMKVRWLPSRSSAGRTAPQVLKHTLYMVRVLTLYRH